MDWVGSVVGLVVGVLVGAGALWLALRGRSDVLQGQIDELKKSLESEIREKEEKELRFRESLKESADSLREAEKASSDLKARLEERVVSHEKEIRALENAEARLKEAFKNLSTDSLKEARDEFTKVAKQLFDHQTELSEEELEARRVAIENLVKPLDSKLSEYKTMLTDMSKRTGESQREQKTIIENLQNALTKQHELATDIRDLFRNPTKRGSLGEEMFESLLQQSGLQKDIHYVMQKTTAQGRPDCHIKMPDNLTFVVDIKWPHDHYEKAALADDDAVRDDHLKTFTRQVRNTIKSLGDKDYAADVEPKIVIMYLPIEAALSAALSVDPELNKFARENGVQICTPNVLYFFLQHVGHVWRQHQVSESNQEIVKVGTELLDRIRVVVEHLNAVGKGLKASVDAYNSTVSSIDRNLYTSAKRLEELGIQGARELPGTGVPVAEPDREFMKPELIGKRPFEDGQPSLE